jgi:hypothetical protein
MGGTLEAISGILVGPVPVEEIIWAFLFGGTWSVIILFVAGPPNNELLWRRLSIQVSKSTMKV